ncbi:hypothetical protein P8452_56499 [Trifolium repens]|nr:hypothetical protein P8452_56499 [Trifolium repens]
MTLESSYLFSLSTFREPLPPPSFPETTAVLGSEQDVSTALLPRLQHHRSLAPAKKSPRPREKSRKKQVGTREWFRFPFDLVEASVGSKRPLCRRKAWT